MQVSEGSKYQLKTGQISVTFWFKCAHPCTQALLQFCAMQICQLSNFGCVSNAVFSNIYNYIQSHHIPSIVVTNGVDHEAIRIRFQCAIILRLAIQMQNDTNSNWKWLPSSFQGHFVYSRWMVRSLKVEMDRTSGAVWLEHAMNNWIDQSITYNLNGYLKFIIESNTCAHLMMDMIHIRIGR